MNNYSNEEKVDMIELYFKLNRNANAAAEAYAQQFPERNQLHQRQFKYLVINLINYGTFQPDLNFLLNKTFPI